jgi:adenylate cyclase, class 2
MQTVEVRAKIREMHTLHKALRDRGITFNDPSLQRDTLYIHADWNGAWKDPGQIILHIREQTGRAVLTSERYGKIEHETAVASPKETAQILSLIGFRPFLEIKKYRQTARFNTMEIRLDVVEELGDYIQVEVPLKNEKEVENIQAELYGFLESIGISREDVEKQEYAALIRLKSAQNP